MTDTKHLEHIALHLISFRLLKAGLLVAAPSFDSEGADLLILTALDENAKICKAQSKYRSLIRSSSSSIAIKAEYLEPNLVVFLFIDDGSENYQNLYCFFKDDVAKWEKNSTNEHILSFTKNTFNNQLSTFILEKDRITRIRNILEKSDARKEIQLILASQTNLQFDIEEIYKDDKKTIRLEKTPVGTIPIITDNATGTERFGSPMPYVNNKQLQYNHATDTWSTKLE